MVFKGMLRLEDDPAYSIAAQSKTGVVVHCELERIQFNRKGGETKSHVIDHFVDCILNGETPIITGEEGMCDGVE
jgi:hypothetical protein